MADEGKPLIGHGTTSKRKYCIVVALVVIVAAAIALGVALSKSSKEESSSCPHSIVGAGWGGVYYAWRLSVASTGPKIDAKDICIFEASPVRVGGRILSTQAPESDLIVDLGGYRFAASQEFVKNAVRTLNLTQICYSPTCDEDMWKIVDDKGLPTGYLHVITSMLNDIRRVGGRDVFMSHELVSIEDTGNLATPFALIFKNGQVVKTSSVLLNLPRPAIKSLQNTTSNILFSKASPRHLDALLLSNFPELRACKQYIYYQDAWWYNYLDLFEGSFDDSNDLRGRYHDGPIQCVNGTCRGALLSMYGVGPFCTRLANLLEANASDVQGVILLGGNRSSSLLKIHHDLMNYHAKAFTDRGIDPSNISLPVSTIFAVWDGSVRPIYPGFLYFDDGDTFQQNLAISPIPGSRLFVANVDFGPEDSWAEGSLVLVERILSKYWGALKPSAVSDAYWESRVLPPKCNTTADCSPGTCRIAECVDGGCLFDYAATGSLCNVGDRCVAEARCDNSGACLPTADVSCPGGQVCNDGTCEPFVWPTCNYSSEIGDFHLKWELQDDKIRMAFSVPVSSPGWAGLGIGSSMIDADMFVATFQGERMTLTDRFSRAFALPSIDVDFGGRDDLKNTHYFWLEGKPFFYFERAVDTGDLFDYPFVNGSQKFLYAWGAGGLTYHEKNAGSVQLDISSCPA